MVSRLYNFKSKAHPGSTSHVLFAVWQSPLADDQRSQTLLTDVLGLIHLSADLSHIDR